MLRVPRPAADSLDGALPALLQLRCTNNWLCTSMSSRCPERLHHSGNHCSRSQPVTRLRRIRRHFATRTCESRQGWRYFKNRVVEFWQYCCFWLRLERRLHRAWPFTLLAWLRSRGVPTVKGLGRLGDNKVDNESLAYHAEIIKATDKFGGDEKMLDTYGPFPPVSRVRGGMQTVVTDETTAEHGN